MKRKIVFLPYDFDTALGINNEGALVFGYNLEDVDHTESGAEIFNGQSSVLWQNLRAAFGDELKAMYKDLRSKGKLSYPLVEGMFEEHQSKWPEAIFNEDSWYKYLAPLVESGDASYLSMLQGSKEEQRKWWMYNRFRYIDSKYNAGDALSDVITIRAYAKSNVTITPYADIYASVRYGSYDVQQRAARGQSYTLVCPVDRLNDTEVYIYSASQLASVGDLSGFKVGYANFSMATKLQSLKLGDSDQSYTNGNLTELYLGNNELLQTIDVRNCPALTQPIDISGCKNIEYAYFDGTGITGLSLPNGGILKVLHVPETMANMTIRNQTAITDFSIPSGANITTLRLENVSSAVNEKAILLSLPADARVRLIGFVWDVADYAEAAALYDKLDTMRGLDEQGGNVDHAQVLGAVRMDSLTGAQLASLKERYSDIEVLYQHITSILTYRNWDGTLITTETILDGGDGSYAGRPSRAQTAQYTYTFAGWNIDQSASTADANATKAVTADRTVYAIFTSTVRTYTITWANDDNSTLATETYQYGATPNYKGGTPVSKVDSSYPFEGWTPAIAKVTGAQTYKAKYETAVEVVVAEIEDDWATIISKINAGTASYKLGNYKPLDLGSEGIVNMQIVAKDADPLASGAGNAPYTWISMELLANTHRMNTNIKYNTKSVPSFTADGDTWTSQNRYTDSTAKATWMLTATSAGTVSINYKTSNASTVRNRIWTLTVNGTEVARNYANTTGATHTVEVNAGDVVVIYCEYDLKNDEYNYYSTITFSSTGTFTIVSEIDNTETRDTSSAVSGTGTIGGWENTEMRSYLKNTIKPLIPAVVRSAIKEVTKYTMITDTSLNRRNDVTSIDDVWIPSSYEIFGSIETSGPVYSAIYTNYSSRIKKRTGSQYNWWMRTAADTQKNFLYTETTGNNTPGLCTGGRGISLGFCL